MNVVVRGVVGLLASKKACMCILILIVTSILTFIGRVDGTSYAATMTVIGSIFMWSVQKTETSAMTIQKLQQSGQQ